MNPIIFKEEEPCDYDLILTNESEDILTISYPHSSADITVKDEPTDDLNFTSNIDIQSDHRTVERSKDVSSKEFLKLGNKITQTKCSKTEAFKIQRFKSFFGVTPHICSIAWEHIRDAASINFQPKHLLWGLLFLKQYTNEHNRRATLKVDEKTIRTWTWVALDLLSNLNVINWEDRTHDSIAGQTVFCSLDSVDCKIKKTTPLSPKWYSHKLRGAGLRYEIGICIQTGHIVWRNGGYPCGEYSALTLAQQSYILSVDATEKTFANRSYRDAKFFIVPSGENKLEHGRIMARHEEVKKRLRLFAALKQSFRHDLEKHPIVFNAVTNLIQLTLKNGESLGNV